MRAIDNSDVEKVLPFAREQAAQRGLLYSADDSSIIGLASAHVNYEILNAASKGRAEWCQCKPEGDQIYFRSKDTGSHGWMCSKCRRVTQTG